MIETGTVVRVPCPLPTVKSDPILVAEVFTNLTSNAIKFVPDLQDIVSFHSLTQQEDLPAHTKEAAR